MKKIIIKFTVQDVRAMLNEAFDKGVDWHETYHTWFTPSRQQSATKRRGAVDLILFKHAAKKVKKP